MGHCGRTGYRPLEADFVGPPELTHFVFLIMESAAEEESHPAMLLDISLVEFGI